MPRKETYLNSIDTPKKTYRRLVPESIETFHSLFNNLKVELGYLPDNVIPVVKKIADLNRMVTSLNKKLVNPD